MSSLDPEVPPAGEETHLPGPSVLPILTAFGLTLALIGITTFIELTVIGSLIAIYAIGRWVKETRVEIDALPLDGHDEG